MYSLEKTKEFNSQCMLGEGLFVNENHLFWLDIERKSILSPGETIFTDLPFIPTVIFDFEQPNILMGTDLGIVKFNITTGQFSVLSPLTTKIEKEFRSNDGGLLQDKTLLGFMHMHSPDTNPGFILSFNENVQTKIDGAIKIPNGFIQLDQKSVLICDSFSGEIWKFTDLGNSFKKEIWHDCGREFSPDGGCIIDNKIFICMWGSSCIYVFDLNGNKQEIINVEVEFPTNCKYIEENRTLALTSANYKNQNGKHICDGNTFLFKIVNV